MKTIGERAIEYSKRCRYVITAYDAYIVGAADQKVIDIDKACEWLDRHLHLFVMKGHINHSTLEQEFRKAMEE